MKREKEEEVSAANKQIDDILNPIKEKYYNSFTTKETIIKILGRNRKEKE